MNSIFQHIITVITAGAAISVAISCCGRPNTDVSAGCFIRSSSFEMLIALSDHSGYEDISITDGSIDISNRAIDMLVKRGDVVIAPIIELLECKQLDFDLFARGYCVCQQIFRKRNPGSSLLWYGGATTTQIRGLTRINPGAQIDVNAFRREVVSDIKQKLLLAK